MTVDTLRRAVAAAEPVLANVKPAQVIGVALSTHGLDDESARNAIAVARDETGLPCDDLLRFGADAFYAAISPHIRKTPVRADA